jgi:hypothetical protein
MQRKATLLKRKDETCKGILLAPSKHPRFSSSVEIYYGVGFGHGPRSRAGGAPIFCGADGKPPSTSIAIDSRNGLGAEFDQS